MLFSSVGSWRTRACAAMGLIAVTSAVVIASADPAEARRRHHRAVGGGYNPPTAAMVVDAKTGRTLYAMNEDAQRHPASLTKVMTLYLLFEQLEKGRFNLDTPLKVSAHAQSMEPSKLGLRAGETISVQDAIKAVVTKSANDIAVTIAENVGGSEEAFAEMMTRKARALGMSRTTFVNASGLPDVEQVTTAHDLVTLGRAIQDRFPRYYAYFSTSSFSYDGRVYRNHNRLLGRVEGVDGIKTGYTRMSGFNLLTSAKSGGRQIVAAVLGGRSGRARDAQMASLVDQHLGRAYAGARTAPLVAENSDAGTVAARRPVVVAEARPAAVATADDAREDAKRVEAPRAEAPRAEAKPREEVTQEEAKLAAPATTSSLGPVTRPKVIETQVKPVVASAAGSTTTPSSNGLRWVVGAQPATVANKDQERLGEGVRAYAPLPRPEGVAREPAKEHAKVASAEPAKAQPEKTEIQKTPVSGWVIQLGATDDQEKANAILSKAKSARVLAKASPFTEKVVKGNATLWRARFAGFDADDAEKACKALKREGFSCIAIRG